MMESESCAVSAIYCSFPANGGDSLRSLPADLADEVQAEEPVGVGERLELGSVGYLLVRGERGQGAQRGRGVEIVVEGAEEAGHILRAHRHARRPCPVLYLVPH